MAETHLKNGMAIQYHAIVTRDTFVEVADNEDLFYAVYDGCIIEPGRISYGRLVFYESPDSEQIIAHSRHAPDGITLPPDAQLYVCLLDANSLEDEAQQLRKQLAAIEERLSRINALKAAAQPATT